MDWIVDFFYYLLVGIVKLVCWFLRMIIETVGNFILYKVEENDMYPSLKRNEHVIVQKTFSDYDYGDVVKCVDKEEYKKEKITIHFISRVVGLPGDIITIKDGLISIQNKIVTYEKRGYCSIVKNGELYEELEETLPNGKKNIIYKYTPAFPEDEEEEPEETIVVPPNHFYLYCDVRWNGYEAYTFDPIAIRNIQGKVVKVINEKDYYNVRWKFFKYAFGGYKKEINELS